MKISVRLIFLSLCFIGLTVSSCSDYQKVLKSGNYDKKYELAVKYYEKRDYFRASSLFEEMLPIVRGTKRAEKTFYYYAQCQYWMKEYLMAAFHFDNFVKMFAKSEYTEECMFLAAKCYFLDSPIYSLDQSNTAKAINEIQLFVDKFPQSTRIPECNELLDQLRVKLETKSYENALLYYNTEHYKAAVFAFRSLMKDFPDTKYREISMFYIVKSAYLYGFHSIEEKKLERYQAAVEAFTNYMDAFPAGKYVKDVQSVFDNTVKQIDKLKKASPKQI